MFRLLCWAFLLCFLLFFPKPVQADQYFFQDEFNTERAANTLDPNKWVVYPNTNSNFTTAQESGGELTLSQENHTSIFPLIVSKNAFPNGDFSFEMSFHFYEIGEWDSGFGLTVTEPINGQPIDDFLYIHWREGWFIQGYTVLRGFGGITIWNEGPSTNNHLFKIDRVGKKYLIYIDNSLIYTSADTDLQAKYFYMGVASISNPSSMWSKFKVDYVRVKDLSPPPPTKTPLILIPGIGGSELKTSEDVFWNMDNGHGGIFNYAYPAGEKVWVNTIEAAKPGNDDYFDILRMRGDGINSEANLQLTGDLFSGAYQGLIDFFTSNGYTLNQDLFVFPYDWRKDVALTTPLLDQKITEIKNQTGTNKVDIVAHSMGGLIARNYISDPNRALNVRKLFTLGTPHLGSVRFLKNLEYGDCLTVFEQLSNPICLGVSSSEVKDVIQNSIGGYQLNPTQKYFDFYNGNSNIYPLPFNDSADIDNNGIGGPLNYDQIKSLLTNLGHNTSLFTPTETFHNLDNNLSNTNGVETYIISGSGLSTLGQIIEKNMIDFAGITLKKKDELIINGDETVPLYSASLNDPFRNLSFSGNASIYYTKQKHSSLVSNGSALNLVKNILAGDSQIPNGVSSTPFPLNGHQLSVHSPVNIHVYDSNGNHTGPTSDGDFEANIPDSSYDSLDDAKFIFLPDNGTYRINFEATDNGSFDFKIRNYQNDQITEAIIYRNIPLTNTTKAQTFFITSFDPFPILIDSDGNSIFDSQVGPSGQISGSDLDDQTPPQVSINAIPKTIWPPNGKMVDVTITGNSSDPNIYRTKITVEDEYQQVEPVVTGFNQTIKLQASRREDDKDGRKYTIKATAEDLSGNFSEAKVEVIVPHDQKK